MVRERTPARMRPKSQLGDSYIIDSDGDDEYTPQSLSYVRQQDGMRPSQPNEPIEIPRKRPARTSARASAEPEFIMPSIHEGSIGNAWLGGERRRIERSPEKRNKKPQKTRHRDEGRSRKASEMTAQDIVADFGATINAFVKPMLSWMYDVLGGALQSLKTPMSYLLAVWLLFGLLVFVRHLLFSSIYTALSPICRIPGSSFLNLPMCKSPISVQHSGDDPPPVHFDQLMAVQDKFEAVLQESAGGVSLPLDMKRGETSIRDLRQVVRFSQLHSKNELVLEFDGFIETARIASYDLQKFNSHVGRGVDNILATARWTKRVLGGIAERDASKGAISWFVNDKILAPFQPIKFTEDVLLQQYIEHTRVIEGEINRLVAEAQALLHVLQNLEDRLDVIHGIVMRDNLHTKGGKDEVMKQLWTVLGGNRNMLGKYDSQLRLLEQVNTYRQHAIAHVAGTLIRLQGMGSELEELRERVGAVELLGSKAGVPLSIHIENIEMGVERLERGRKGAKELENEEMRKSLERVKGPERMIEAT